jgi:hypothetical protein
MNLGVRRQTEAYRRCNKMGHHPFYGVTSRLLPVDSDPILRCRIGRRN